MKKESLKIALAYVGIIVGAGLSSGQDLLQYFLCFGKFGILGAVMLGILNILFGRIIVTLGAFYQSNSHNEVLEKITKPVINRIIDFTLIISNFVMGFVMIAGAGANLSQQFSIPSWAGALMCAVLIIIVSFMDFEKITNVLGMFTPVIIAMIFLITVYTFMGKHYDFNSLDTAAKTIKPAIPSIWLSVVNYFSLCVLTGVSMAFVLGGSVIRIRVAEKGGALGGMMIGFVIFCASITLFANIDKVKGAEIPMLDIFRNINPILSVVYSIIIFVLIFNTAFSLFYSTARRFAGDDDKKMRGIIIAIVMIGYICSFGGFKTLVSKMYPILGYMGIILLFVLLVAWVSNYDKINREKIIRRKIIHLHLKKYDKNMEYTDKDQKIFEKIGEKSVVNKYTLYKDIKDYACNIIESPVDTQEFVEKELSIDNESKDS